LGLRKDGESHDSIPVDSLHKSQSDPEQGFSDAEAEENKAKGGTARGRGSKRRI